MSTAAGEPTGTGLVPAEDLRALRTQRRAAERARELAALLEQRPDLRGAYAPADLAVDAVSWCA